MFFPNEKATEEAINSSKYYDWMESRGFKRENVRIFNYFKPDGFANQDIDCIHISGGNTFQALDRIRKSGADKLIKEYVRCGAVYIGGSAGAHIATLNIEHLIPIDKNTTNVTDYKGLGLFDGILFCHYNDERKVFCDNAVKSGKYKVYTLTDEQSIVVSDDKILQYN